jgi:hypothetical protein
MMLIKVAARTNAHMVIYHLSTGPYVCNPLKCVVFLSRWSSFDGTMPHLRSPSKCVNTSFRNEETRWPYKATKTIHNADPVTKGTDQVEGILTLCKQI